MARQPQLRPTCRLQTRTLTQPPPPNIHRHTALIPPMLPMHLTLRVTRHATDARASSVGLVPTRFARRTPRLCSSRVGIVLLTFFPTAPVVTDARLLP
eukprot:1648826-Pleurochrysis_carterae.AAC.1